MEIYGITWAECFNYLSRNPRMCATKRGWSPTKFVKVETYRNEALPWVFDLSLKNKKFFVPEFKDTVSANWQIYDGGDKFGDINTIGV